ncbi:MAG: PLDc N-terminal domain-containing protein [Chitinophagaceae bacterium]|nr:PLDc N-terminal domain-containing protein [Oligoflexus sp.]
MIESWLYELFSQWIQPYWPYLLTFVTTVLSVFAAGHAIMTKRDVRSALGWAGLVLLSPGLGVILYFCLGINRVRRKALALRNTRVKMPSGFYRYSVEPVETAERYGEAGETLLQIAKTLGFVSGKPLLRGNSIDVLNNGEEAYPAMLAAIHNAKRSISLQTYIFASDRLGLKFVDALEAAVKRGVAVRVLIDGIGVRYSFHPVHKLLRARGVPTALFIPVRNIKVLNLRTHRKIMVVDGASGFTGGMNIRLNHVVSEAERDPTIDVHFHLQGPVVQQLQEVFADDWNFATNEILHGPQWVSPLEMHGTIFARGIADGPDESVSALALTLHAAISAAKKRVRVVTPYFVPDITLLSALGVAACRGIEVDIVIPLHGNLRLVQWAAWSQLQELISFGCRIWLTPLPFDHSKLMTVDGLWALFGSSNWDTRSLRLNFEHNIEAHDQNFAQKIDEIIEGKIARAFPLAFDQVTTRPFWKRFRDSLARLGSPYL